MQHTDHILKNHKKELQEIEEYNQPSLESIEPIKELFIPANQRIAVVSDLHLKLSGILDTFDAKQLDAVLRLAETHEHVFINGDLFDGSDTLETILEGEIYADFFFDLFNKTKVYLTIGNHDRDKRYNRDFVWASHKGRSRPFYTNRFLSKFEAVANVFLVRYGKNETTGKFIWIEHGDRLEEYRKRIDLLKYTENFPLNTFFTYSEISIYKLLDSRFARFFSVIFKPARKIFEYSTKKLNNRMKSWIKSRIKNSTNRELVVITGHSHLSENSVVKKKSKVRYINTGTFRPFQNGEAVVIDRDDINLVNREEIILISRQRS